MLERAKIILQIIGGEGGEARFVGGCVRDKICGRPVNDIDIATTLTPDQVTKLFEKREIMVIPTGIQFGTVTIIVYGESYEITTLRKDIKCFGRHAEVEFSQKFEDDSARRDFTFNALYMDQDEKVYDYHDGIRDLENGVVRFIGSAEARITEDYLRILRMFRFHAGFGKGDIIGHNLEACIKHRDGLDAISGERIKEEVKKMFSYGNDHIMLTMLETGIIQKIFNLDAKDVDFNNLRNYFDNVRLFSNRDCCLGINFITAISSFIPNDEVSVEKISERMKFSSKEWNFIARLAESQKIDYSDDYEVRKNIRIEGKEEFFEYVILALSRNIITRSRALDILGKMRDFDIPEFPIKAHMLMSQLGLKPGKELGNYLRKAEEIWERHEYMLDKGEIIKKLNTQ